MEQMEGRLKIRPFQKTSILLLILFSYVSCSPVVSWHRPKERLALSSLAMFTSEDLFENNNNIDHCKNACEDDQKCKGFYYTQDHLFCQGVCWGSCLYFDKGYLPHESNDPSIYLDGQFQFKYKQFNLNEIAANMDTIKFKREGETAFKFSEALVSESAKYRIVASGPSSAWTSKIDTATISNCFLSFHAPCYWAKNMETSTPVIRNTLNNKLYRLEADHLRPFNRPTYALYGYPTYQDISDQYYFANKHRGTDIRPPQTQFPYFLLKKPYTNSTEQILNIAEISFYDGQGSLLAIPIENYFASSTESNSSLGFLCDSNPTTFFQSSSIPLEMKRDQFIRIFLTGLNVTRVNIVNRVDLPSRIVGVSVAFVNTAQDFAKTITTNALQFNFGLKVDYTSFSQIYRNTITNELFSLEYGLLRPLSWSAYAASGYLNYVDSSDQTFFEKIARGSSLNATSPQPYLLLKKQYSVDNNDQILNIADIELFHFNKSALMLSSDNVFVSTLGTNSSFQNLIDGDRSTNLITEYTKNLEFSRDQFVRVYLNANISYIRIHNRIDCCFTRLDGVILTVINGTLNFTITLSGSGMDYFIPIVSVPDVPGQLYRNVTSNHLFYVYGDFKKRYDRNIYILTSYPDYIDIDPSNATFLSSKITTGSLDVYVPTPYYFSLYKTFPGLIFGYEDQILSIGDILFFDTTGNPITIPRSSFFASSKGNNSDLSMLNDQNPNTYFSTDISTLELSRDQFVRVNLTGVTVSYLKLYGRQDCCASIFQNVILRIVTSTFNYSMTLTTSFYFSIVPQLTNGWIYRDTAQNIMYKYENNSLRTFTPSVFQASGYPQFIDVSNTDLLSNVTKGADMTISSSVYYFLLYKTYSPTTEQVLSISEVYLYNTAGQRINFTFNDVTVSSQESNSSHFARTLLFDGSPTTYLQTSWTGAELTRDQYVKISIPSDLDIAHLRIMNRLNCCQFRMASTMYRIQNLVRNTTGWLPSDYRFILSEHNVLFKAAEGFIYRDYLVTNKLYSVENGILRQIPSTLYKSLGFPTYYDAPDTFFTGYSIYGTQMSTGTPLSYISIFKPYVNPLEQILTIVEIQVYDDTGKRLTILPKDVHVSSFNNSINPLPKEYAIDDNFQTNYQSYTHVAGVSTPEMSRDQFFRISIPSSQKVSFVKVYPLAVSYYRQRNIQATLSNSWTTTTATLPGGAIYDYSIFALPTEGTYYRDMTTFNYYKYEGGIMKPMNVSVYQQLGLPNYQKVYNQNFLTNFTFGDNVSYSSSVTPHIFVYKTAFGTSVENVLPTSEFYVYDENGVIIPHNSSNIFVQSSDFRNWNFAIDGDVNTLYQSDWSDGGTQDLSLDQFFRMSYGINQKISRVKTVNRQTCCRSRLSLNTTFRIVAAGGINITTTVYNLNFDELNIIANLTEGMNYRNRRTGDIYNYAGQTLRRIPFHLYHKWGAPWFIDVQNEGILAGITTGADLTADPSPPSTTFVLIYLPYTGNPVDTTLHLKELIVYGEGGRKINIAWPDVWFTSEALGYERQYLVDGNLTTYCHVYWGTTPFTLVESRRDLWLRVSFKNTTKISSVYIQNRDDDQGVMDRFKGSFVSVNSCGNLWNNSITVGLSNYTFNYTTC